MDRLFDAPADATRLQTFSVRGLDAPISSTVYPGGVLEDGGMPLGGIGTGYVVLDTDLRLGACAIFHDWHTPRRLDGVWLRLRTGERTVEVAALVEGRGQAYDIRYVGHLPVADVRAEAPGPFAIDVRAFAPIIPGDVRATHTPAIIFDVILHNRGDAPASADVIWALEGFPAGTASPFAEAMLSGVEVMHPWAGYDPLPGSGPVHGTYAVAATEAYVETEGDVIALAAPRVVPAGGSTSVRFILGWHEPHLRESSNRVERPMYATWFASAREVVAYAAARADGWLRRILRWQDAVYGSDLPPWMQETLVAAPYALVKNAWWLARSRPDDWWGDEGLFVVNESITTCPSTETMPCRFFGNWPALLLFPEWELSTLRAIRHFQLRDGEPPFSLGITGWGIRDPRYHCQHTAGAGEYAEIIHRYCQRTGDDATRREWYPSARDAIEFMLSLDTDRDGLVDEQPHVFGNERFPANNPLDQWPWYGVSSYTAIKGLAALGTAIRLAEQVGDDESGANWREVLRRGQEALERRLWTGSYYRTYDDPAGKRRNDACFSAQLSGVWSARTLGVPDPVPQNRILAALAAIARLNAPASPYGMVDAVFPDGRPCEEGGPARSVGGTHAASVWSRDCFYQCNATAAMVYLYLGDREVGDAIGRRMANTVFRGPHAMPWAQPCAINTITGGTAHGHDYYDAMVVWSYPLAWRGETIAEACAPGGFVARILDAAKEA